MVAAQIILFTIPRRITPMNSLKHISALGVLAFVVGALAFMSAPIASITPALAQQISAANGNKRYVTGSSSRR